MRTILKSVCIAAALCLSLGAIAQPPPPPPEGPGRQMNPERHTERMSRELELSPEQTSAVGEINQRFAEQLNTLRGSEEEQQARRQAMKNLKREHDAELRGVLDDEQYAKYEEHRRQMMERRKQHRNAKEPPPAAPPAAS